MVFDIVIRNGTVYDGNKGKGLRADVGIKDGRIEAVGDLRGGESGRVLDAEGMAVCPGFINIHSHDDLYLLQPDRPGIYEAYMRQGITTSVVGNCGWSAAPWFPRHGDILRQLLVSMGLPGDLEPRWQTQAEFHSCLQSLSPGRLGRHAVAIPAHRLPPSICRDYRSPLKAV